MMHGGKREFVIVGLTTNISHPNLGEVGLEVESFAVVILCAARIGQDGQFHKGPLRLTDCSPHGRYNDAVIVWHKRHRSLQ